MQTASERNTFVVRAKCLTPVCIQSGQEILPWEYAIYKSHLYRFDVGVFYDGMRDDNDRIEFERLLGKGEMIAVRHFMWERLVKDDATLLKSIATYTIPASKDVIELYDKNIRKTDELDKEINQLIVKEFPNAGGHHYIPGSSIKGALRTSVLAVLKAKDRPSNAYVESIESHSGSASEAEVDEFHVFTIRDAGLPDDAVRVGQFKRGEGITQFCEYLPAGTVFSFTVTVNRIPGESDRIDFSGSELTNVARAFMESKIWRYVEALDAFTALINRQATRKKIDDNKLDQIERAKQFFESMQSGAEADTRIFHLTMGFGVGYWLKVIGGSEKRPAVIKKDAHYKDPSLQIARTWWHADSIPVVGFLECTVQSTETAAPEANDFPAVVGVSL